MVTVRKGLLAGVVMLTGLPGAALADVRLDGTLKATQACDAPSARSTGRNPGEIRLEPGRSYPVRARNKDGGDLLKIRVEGADPEFRWVPESCGQVAVAPPAPKGQPAVQPPVQQKADAGGQGALGRPFFDAKDEGVKDPAPVMPDLDAFDRGLLTLCGPWGSHPTADSFAAMLLTVFPEEVQALRQALDFAVRTPGAEPALFVRELTDLWFKEGAFPHVFCGEPGEKSLGGLHFQARFLQAQWAGWAGRADTGCTAQAVSPPVYSTGVIYRKPGGGEGKACPKSYRYGQGGREILIEATRAWKQAVDWAGPSARLACRASTAEGQAATLVLKDGVIRTYYPVAVPDLNDPRCDRSE